MDKQHVKGAVDKTRGTIKDAFGRATGDILLQTEGKADETKGGLRTTPANMNDFFRGRR